MTKIILKNMEDTEKLARILAKETDEKLLLTLSGDLATGKTTFTKYFAKHLGIKDTVNSPTFNILKEYTTDKINFYHIDAYRLENSEEDLGFEEIFYENNICVIEWAEFIEDFLPRERLSIKIQFNNDLREVTIFSKGEYYEKLERNLIEQWLA
ncbi:MULTISPECIES: tRNA (adenosine(37)-N6)-threonylcarbamoyltransferase complex ATPase subunit type 1 TsaE [unclassified Gemella]|uniref:tRNA (adenosine(37)-N6)-threonylcarbamoyltransferase complex ATPase subunit type 1 TsaE n=1 Tax=unclassified Gemella TaxID=2624949 RepID=UPI001C03EB9E|nr:MULTISPECIES: tRNA (adenosine(37)-N6)-threonylcarbamoyltransferase complex ATPase subunit type 1 TsaE [unclassified Gemella]MBU0278041.1 tRNA (adenosine(37)-N6)-threonylcarbamoyltransferase complex ATPase subunit type 1 TsaE [Gemella sp. zg-1178]QWQ38430.1 tRNA (adenosine(37)-N6)-threonylcarbamoyltransferase complex ATPase subunit type 1 TsaE [Gemella sp. zg-570]